MLRGRGFCTRLWSKGEEGGQAQAGVVLMLTLGCEMDRVGHPTVAVSHAWQQHLLLSHCPETCFGARKAREGDFLYSHAPRRPLTPPPSLKVLTPLPPLARGGPRSDDITDSTTSSPLEHLPKICSGGGVLPSAPKRAMEVAIFRMETPHTPHTPLQPPLERIYATQSSRSLLPPLT